MLGMPISFHPGMSVMHVKGLLQPCTNRLCGIDVMLCPCVVVGQIALLETLGLSRIRLGLLLCVCVTVVFELIHGLVEKLMHR